MQNAKYVNFSAKYFKPEKVSSSRNTLISQMKLKPNDISAMQDRRQLFKIKKSLHYLDEGILTT